MGVWHYLFWLENNKITAVLNKGNSFEIIKFGGNRSIEYTENFWEMWRDYAGFLKDDFIDFCFVFDDECPQVSEYLKMRECPENECIWDQYAIQNAVNMLGIRQPTQIFNENGVCIVKTGSFRNIDKSDIIKLAAVYRNSEKEIFEEKSETAEMTPFIEDMLTKLKKYDKEQ